MHLVIEKKKLNNKQYLEYLDKEIKSYVIKDQLPSEIISEFIRQKDCNIIFYFVKKYSQYIKNIDDDIIISLTGALNGCKISTDVNEILLLIAKKSKTGVKIEYFMRFISYLQLKDNDFEFIMGFFSYTEIYKYSKKILSTFFCKNYRVNEIGYSLVIINHPKLCYKNLLPLFKQINQLLDPNIKIVLESSFINICKGMQAILTYLPETFANKKELLLGVLTFINKSLFLTELYEFICLDDLYIILDTVKVLIENIEIDKRTKNVMKSTFNKCINQIYFFNESKTIRNEDILLYIAVLNLSNLYIGISELNSEKMCNIFEVVEDIYIVYSENAERLFPTQLNEYFLFEKYRLLQKLEVFTKFKVNTIKFINDIKNVENIYSILKRVDINQLNVDILMPYCTNKKFQHGFSSKIFELDENFHEYIFIYLDSLITKKNLFVQLLILKSNLLKKLCMYKQYFPFLIRLFCQNFNENEIVFWEIKCEVIKHLLRDLDSSFDLHQFEFSHTEQHYILLLVLLNLYKNTRPSTILNFLKYFNICLNMEAKNQNEKPEIKEENHQNNICQILNQEHPISNNSGVEIIREFKELKITKSPIKKTEPKQELPQIIFEKLLNYEIEIHILALLYSKIDHKISKELLNEKTFKHILIKLLASAFCQPKKLLEGLEKQLVEFLFIASNEEKNIIRDLYYYIQENTNSDLEYILINEEIINIVDTFEHEINVKKLS